MIEKFFRKRGSRYPNNERIKSKFYSKKNLTSKLGKSIMGFGFNLVMKSKSIAYDKSSDNVSLKVDEFPKEEKKLQETFKKMSTEIDPTKFDNKLIKEYTKQYV